MIQLGQDHAVMTLVCTDRGQHREQVIELLERDGGPGGHWSEGRASAKGAYDAVLSELLNGALGWTTSWWSATARP